MCWQGFTIQISWALLRDFYISYSYINHILCFLISRDNLANSIFHILVYTDISSLIKPAVYKNISSMKSEMIVITFAMHKMNFLPPYECISFSHGLVMKVLPFLSQIIAYTRGIMDILNFDTYYSSKPVFRREQFLHWAILHIHKTFVKGRVFKPG